jgi:glycosyltransferase involved in cell wall biosynthesis
MIMLRLEMAIEVAFFETDQVLMDPQRPESLCGVNSIISTFLRSLAPFVDKFHFSTLVPKEKILQMTALFRASDLHFIRITSYEDFAAANQFNDRVVLQILGHGIDRAAAFRARVNTAWAVVGMTHDLFHREVYKSLYLYTENRSEGDVIVCASRSAQAIIRHYLDRIASSFGSPLGVQLPLVPHGVDFDAIRRTPKEVARTTLGFAGDELVFLYFGRLSIWQKADLCGLIRCFANQFRGSRARLILAGGAIDPENNPEIRAILAEIAGSGSGNISVFFNVDESERGTLFSAADVFVSPSNSFQEAFGLSIVEAMLYQLPVIATKWSGYRDIVLDSRTGYLVRARWMPSDRFSHLEVEHTSEVQRARATASCVKIDWEEFGLRMRELSIDHVRRDRFGLDGLVRARSRFTATNMASNYAEIWTNLAERRLEVGHRKSSSELIDLIAEALVDPFEQHSH